MERTNSESKEFDENDLVQKMLKEREYHAKQQKYDYSHVFRPKSYLDFVRIACINLGIELSYAAQTSFVSPLLLQTGVEHQHMTLVWALSPLLGFFIAPILGTVSDRCRLSLGRRRPLIILLTIGVVLGLIFIPFGRSIGEFLGDTGDTPIPYQNNNSTISTPVNRGGNHIFGIVFIILGTMFVDLNVNMFQTPLRAYMLDVSISSDHPKGLSTFTITAGLGGTMGYILGGVDWEETSFGSFFGGNIQTVFVIVLIGMVLSFIITITSFREIPLPLIEKDSLLRPLTAAAIKKEKEKEEKTPFCIAENVNVKLGNECDDLNKDLENFNKNLENEEEHIISFKQYLKSIVFMPKSMWLLCLTNLFCWMADLCFCLYFTDFVGEAVFGGSPQADEGSEKYELYEEGVRFGCWGLSVYALSCSIYSAIIEKLIKLTSTKIVYIGGCGVFGVGLFILAMWPTKPGVLVFSATSGIIYSTMFTLPYILIARYHLLGCFQVKEGKRVALKEPRGLGTDVAIVSNMIFVAQLIVSLCIGSIITAAQSTTAVLYTSSALSICAAISASLLLYLE